MSLERPLLRPLDFQPVTYQNQQMWFLRDPLKLSEIQLIIPAYMAQLLAFLDGTRTIPEIHASFCQLIGSEIDLTITTDAIRQLDEAYLLDNQRSKEKKLTQLAEYRSLPYRPPALAGSSYPQNAGEVESILEDYFNGYESSNEPSWNGRGIISPHIDYQRGGAVYAQVWKRATQAIAEADLVVIFGTDHNGGPGSITLTHQPYATPYGVLPTDLDLIGKLAEAIGHEAAFADELHHRDEHSVELSAVWLHHILNQAGKTPKPMIPILVGSFHHFLRDGLRPEDNQQINRLIETLRQETNGLNVLAVASVDLAHVGPNFGDNFVMDQNRRTALHVQDNLLMKAALQGDAEDWYNQIAAIQDCNRICGFSPTYLLLRYLGPTRGIQVAYDQCPADNQNASLVSICGLLLD